MYKILPHYIFDKIKNERVENPAASALLSSARTQPSDRIEQAELRTLQTVAARKREAGADIINQGMEDGRECLEAESGSAEDLRDLSKPRKADEEEWGGRGRENNKVNLLIGWQCEKKLNIFFI